MSPLSCYHLDSKKNVRRGADGVQEREREGEREREVFERLSAFVGYSIKEQPGAGEMARDVLCGWTSHSLDR